MKTSRPHNALDFLGKACSAAKKTYGKENKMSKGLAEIYQQQ